MSTIWYSQFDSPLGKILVAQSLKGVVAIQFQIKKLMSQVPATWVYDPQALAIVVKELGEYFSKTRREFHLPLDLHGTAFQLKVWHYLAEIPYGETVTYAEVARAIGLPKGSRAVGGAAKNNPVAIVVACHRVVGQKSLGGYYGGLWRKKALLSLEKSAVAPMLSAKI